MLGNNTRLKQPYFILRDFKGISNKNNDKYISKALNPSISNLHEAQEHSTRSVKTKQAYKQIKNEKTSDIKKKPEMGG